MARGATPAAIAIALVLALTGCGRSGPAAVRAGSGGARFTVLAAENFWGSLAAQLAGDRASVTSIIVNPATDPHSYVPSTGAARRIAGANMVVLNGLGYDEWAKQLLDASPSSQRVVLNIGQRLGLPAGANPHRWYYPADVHAVIGAIVAGYDRLDPADAAYFAARRRRLETVGLASYDALRATIRARYRGVRVGYSESIFEGLGEDLGLSLTTPPSFAKAVAEGTDVTAADRQAVDAQAEQRRIAVWVFNSQNVTPDVQRVNEIVRRRRIPLVSVTETLSPAGASFEQWQVAQLRALAAALHKATGR
ncbi:MAG: putative cation transporter periplasmic cation-binding protein [Solirubrobacterales bacterium]|nr:putative cation transporter periplasmic cation-binding protein [Solirubrobacterales bacterium]